MVNRTLCVFITVLILSTSVLAGEAPLTFKGHFTNEQQNKIEDWVELSLEAVKTAHGSLPMDDFQIVVKPSRWSRGTVPWGEVEREEEPIVTLVVNPKASASSLKNDWTIYHELSHLLIPYDGYGPRWLSEGIASYYQNIVQHRSGLFDSETMWLKLIGGFERGRKQTNYKNFTLAHVSDHLGENRNYMRVYWSGALYWLTVDAKLRPKMAK